MPRPCSGRHAPPRLCAGHALLLVAAVMAATLLGTPGSDQAPRAMAQQPSAAEYERCRHTSSLTTPSQPVRDGSFTPDHQAEGGELLEWPMIAPLNVTDPA